MKFKVCDKVKVHGHLETVIDDVVFDTWYRESHYWFKDEDGKPSQIRNRLGTNDSVPNTISLRRICRI
jgi:hypothetical protein